MRVLVCGDRNWQDLDAIELILSFVGPNDTLVTGMANGADSLAAFAASENGAQIEEFPAKWDLFGKAAGPIRNQQMLDKGRPDIVLAFHDNLSKSKGTFDMIARAKDASVPVYLISHP